MGECYILSPTGSGPAHGTLSVSANNRDDRTRNTIEVTLPFTHPVKSGSLLLASARNNAEIVTVNNEAQTFTIRFNSEDELCPLLPPVTRHLLAGLTERAFRHLVENEEHGKVTASHYLVAAVAQEFLTAFVLLSYGYLAIQEKARPAKS